MSDTPMNDGPEEVSIEEMKAYAKELGISFHPSIGREKLQEKIDEVQDAQENTAPVEAVEPVKESPAKGSDKEVRALKRKEANRLVRIQITCMNPNKKAWEGEIFTVSNGLVGTFKKYVPFNVPWHVPYIIYKQIVNRKCQIFLTPRKGPVTSKLIQEFSVQELPPLSEKELKDLANRQAMAKGEG